MVTTAAGARPDDSLRPKIGIISLGDMGSGLARLLVARGFSVATNCSGRSQDTIDRATAAGVELLASDAALIDACNVILSVVPPRDATATAQRIADALPGASKRSAPLYYADMNAVSPATVRAIAALFSSPATSSSSPVEIRFIDGSILGGPPAPPESTGPSADVSEWYRPLLPTSGPHQLADASAHLALTLRAKHISPDIGAASGLKMCFASLSKGFAAVAIQSITTAQRLGVLPDLLSALADLAPATLARAERTVIAVPPKAYRWVAEMREISATHAVSGGFAPERIFAGAADVFAAMADDTVLGQEKVGRRKRGTTVEDVADAMAEGLERKRKKTE
ncbi:6-phosphogluconate dehydrogenase [Lasiosphaeria miniovina]|uniref:6-phosphogluconate dehydrogenase n=1 Tax=Lasiosphaeria miniovina TaxID=1954250 RepID=A0AA40EFM6_9PEZI|nr:6-phosphogluconate dehydrogenase [Lasiosphaeria miniovina]KAK0733458.1 6-phosphogluconate dehydrogenase [Lasiosphaeria miniovina]